MNKKIIFFLVSILALVTSTSYASYTFNEDDLERRSEAVKEQVGAHMYVNSLIGTPKPNFNQAIEQHAKNELEKIIQPGKDPLDMDHELCMMDGKLDYFRKVNRAGNDAKHNW